MSLSGIRWIILSLVLCSVGMTARAFADDVNFESPPVHPIELSPSGDYLFAAHTADHRLVVYWVGGNAPPRAIAEIMVGLEPVTVRARSEDEAWVINHVSDDISIVNLQQRNVVRTLLVGDEPTDVVFAAGKAFVAVSQEDALRVYDLEDLDAAPVVIPLEMSDPRSLVVSPDSSTVYVTSLDSQNRTTVIDYRVVDAMGGPPAPTPPMNPALPAPPRVSLIVRHDGTHWLDDAGGNWDAAVPYTMPDNDVLAVNTSSLTVTASYTGVGTTLYNIAVHPSTGDLYVTNQEAFNQIRFEPNIRGKFAQNRITHIATSGGAVTPHHINAHINYASPAGDASERASSLAIPLDIAISSAGNEVYVAAFGSRKVGVLDAAGNLVRRIDVGDGPAGLALDEARDRLFVFNRFSSSISVVDLSDDSSTEIPLGYDPTPQNVRDGRKFLYDGEISSAHGDLACGSCHIFGAMDNIAWDLGNPAASAMIPVPPGQLPGLPPFHPMKGPMTTQSLKGLATTEPLHWRGDRAALVDFNPAFVDLMGRTSPLSAGDFQLFDDFIMSIQYPSNPFRLLNGSLPAALDGANPIHGEQLFLTGNLVGIADCVNCHALPTGENGVIFPGGVLDEDEGKKVPQLRNMYEKTRFDNLATSTVRGYGFIHDGSVDDLFSFLQFPAFTFANDNDRRDVAAFLKAFPTGTHPAIGAQWTMDGTNESAGLTRLNTLEAQADLGAIDLVAKGRVLGQARGWVYASGGMYTPDKQGDAGMSQASLLLLAGEGTEITFTGVAGGCGWRLGVDRDLDGFRDGDELDGGSDPGDPSSTPNNPTTAIGDTPTIADASQLWLAGPNPVRSGGSMPFRVEVARSGPVRLEVYDVGGRLVQRLMNDIREVGAYQPVWNLENDGGRSVASGVYFVRLQTADAVRVKRVTIVR
jgi:DNA-binding beta-propeller fold protein YncE